jgi:hypothetical protein
VGPFSGFSLKVYPAGASKRGRADSAVLTGAFNLAGFAIFQAAVLDETDVPQSPLTLYLGPGLALGFDDSDIMFGAVGVAGVRFFRKRVEVYLELSPRLEIAPRVHAVPTAGVGFRVYPR